VGGREEGGGRKEEGGRGSWLGWLSYWVQVRPSVETASPPETNQRPEKYLKG
jgi:hypothetical protein